MNLIKLQAYGYEDEEEKKGLNGTSGCQLLVCKQNTGTTNDHRSVDFCLKNEKALLDSPDNDLSCCFLGGKYSKWEKNYTFGFSLR